MTLIAEPRDTAAPSAAAPIPHRCHASIGVFGAVSVASACLLPGSVAQATAQVAPGDTPLLSVEHPTGEFSVTLQLDADGATAGCGLLRTARLLLLARFLFRPASGRVRSDDDNRVYWFWRGGWHSGGGSGP